MCQLADDFLEGEPLGYVCPDRLESMWEPEMCTVEERIDGKFSVVCHHIKREIYIAVSYGECVFFLDNDGSYPVSPFSEFFPRT